MQKENALEDPLVAKGRQLGRQLASALEAQRAKRAMPCAVSVPRTRPDPQHLIPLQAAECAKNRSRRLSTVVLQLPCYLLDSHMAAKKCAETSLLALILAASCPSQDADKAVAASAPAGSAAAPQQVPSHLHFPEAAHAWHHSSRLTQCAGIARNAVEHVWAKTPCS